MEQPRAKLWQKAKTFAGRYKDAILAILFLLAVVFLIWLDYVSGWTSLGAYENPNYDEESRFLWGKSAWDWLDLLLVPGVLAIVGLLFNRAQRKAEREIAAERTREATLQNYLDKMTELMLEHRLRSSEFDDEIRGIARARTLTALRSLDGSHKGLLLQFLYESDLIGLESVVRLKVADLRSANLYEAYLYEANLQEADFREADMRRATLNGANLVGTDLCEADLRKAYLPAVNLHNANLHGANLYKADLAEAFLGRTDLRNANLAEAKLGQANLHRADLRGADLRGADLHGANLQEANLCGALMERRQISLVHSFEGATMPDGTVHE